MIFKLQSISDERIEKAYSSAMLKLNDFWGIGWTSMTPMIYVVDSRKDLDILKSKKTEEWMVAFASGKQPGDRRVYVLDYDKFATESSWQITEEVYSALIAHELCHLFFGIVSKGRERPSWLNEGLSTYLSGQLKTNNKKKPEKLSTFLSGEMKDAYNEGGFVVEALVNKFGKEKMVQLVASLSEVNSNEDFDKSFENIFGLKLNYDSLNTIYL